MSEEIIYTGEALKKAVFETQPVRETLIQQLIPEKSNTMFFASDGAGKSMVTLQAFAEGSAGLDVYGGLSSKPIKTVIAMTERPKEETFERLKLMSPIIPLNWDNLLVDDSFRGLDLMVPRDYEVYLIRAAKLAERMKGIDIFHIDTVYGTVSEGLSSEKTCGQVNKLLRRLQQEIGCATSYTHHTNRGARNFKTNKREAEDMYGNRFLRANCTGVFKIEKTETGTIFKCEKDTMECLIKEINLNFDAETNVSLMNIMETTKHHAGRVAQYIKDHFKLKKDFGFNEIQKTLGVSVSYLRDQLSVHLKTGQIINLKPLGQKALYRVLRDF